MIEIKSIILLNCINMTDIYIKMGSWYKDYIYMDISKLNWMQEKQTE